MFHPLNQRIQNRVLLGYFSDSLVEWEPAGPGKTKSPVSAMDDDAPLSALQPKVKAPTFDDEMTLAALAKSKPQPKAETNGAAKGKVAKGQSKGKQAQKKEEGSSSSSDDSSSSSSDSGDKKGPKAKAKSQPTKNQRMALLKKQRDGNDEDEEDKTANVVKKRDRTPKQQVVADLLCRWWYALPDWPPADEEHYKPKLAERKLRHVTIQEWEWVPEEDERGFRKVYQLSQFRGVFRNSAGEMIDLRPQETCPCLQNFMKKDLPELYDLLVKAYENQLADLEKSKYNEDKLKKELKTLLNKTRQKGYEARKVAGVKRTRTA